MRNKFKKVIISYFPAAIKYILAFVFSRILFIKKRAPDVWLICEKESEARDNGYHFFKYVKEKRPDINIYYVITRDSPDIEKVKKIGALIYFNSWKHYFFYSITSFSICSQPGGASPRPDRFIRYLNRFMNSNSIEVHLRHGISQNDIPQIYDWNNYKCDLFVCGAKPEFNYIIEKYNYPRDKILLSGLSRFDVLHAIPPPKKIILVMPTFRKWLGKISPNEVANDKEIEEFMKSEYYKRYISLIWDQQVHDLLENNGYKLIFYPHYSMQPYIRAFFTGANSFITDNVIIADRLNYDVQTLLIESALMITDYSSVAFDFVYMKKPVIYYQFDEEKFFNEHYKKGYFDHRSIGFGPVVVQQEDLFNEVYKLMANDMHLSNKYLDRVEDFFIPYDSSNSKRILDKILSIRY